MDKPGMKNMKFDVDTNSTEVFMSQAQDFPIGLSINLDNKVIEKLDLEKMPEVGQMLNLHAMVEVVGVNIDRALGDKRDKNIRLQITDLALQEKSADSLAEVQDEAKEETTTLLG